MRIVILFLMLIASVPAYAQVCGIQPMPPIGCSPAAQCTCEFGRCRWVFTDCQ
jgi:hypothetical protein